MHDLLLVVVPAIITLIGTLAGVCVTHWLTRDRDRRQWRRDRCLEAYADLLQGCHDVVNAANELYVEESDEFGKRQVVIEKLERLHNAQNRVMLLIPGEFEQPLLALVKHLDKIALQAGKSPRPSLEEWTKLVTTDAGRVVGEIAALARRDLT
jgi:hypothetical protein